MHSIQLSLFLHNLFIVYNQLDLHISQKINLFDSLVLPVLNYSAEVSGYHSCPDVEVIFSKFCKRILCVEQSTNLNALHSELRRIPMQAYRKRIIIKYWLTLLTMNEQTYKIKMTLYQLGLINLWKNQ